MYRFLYIAVCLLCVSSISIAQDSEIPERKFGDPFIILKNEATGGILIHSGGFGINVRRGKHVTGFKKRILDFEFVETKHAKEFKRVSTYIDNGKTYVYGKLNSAFMLRTGVGNRKIIFSKAERGGVEVNYTFFIGSSLGIIKPVYLDVIYPSDNPFYKPIRTEKYDPNNKRHIPDNIYGRSGFVKGIDELGFIPGIYSKFGFNFDWCGYDEGIKSLEFGITLDAFTKEIPIMAITDNKQFFLSFYVSIIYGKKW
ncbi:MAG: hypothetical protein JKY33_02820 [Bacteroidia bacterium]|nr:hypothetical protein [Bacteroidia bacterium]